MLLKGTCPSSNKYILFLFYFPDFMYVCDILIISLVNSNLKLLYVRNRNTP